MKRQILFFSSMLLLASCSSLDPKACTCGKELSKPLAEQDQELMQACSEKGEGLSEKQKVKWFNEIMTCVE